MDTISRENNTSYLPFAGLIAGLIALILAIVGLVQVNKLKTANQTFQDEQTAKVSSIESTASAASAAASAATSAVDGATRSISGLQRSTQEAFGQVAGEITRINGEIVKIQESGAKPKVAAKDPKAPAGAAAAAAPAVAGPNEYVIVGGDTGAKIARAKGVSLADLISVNPGVNWTGLKVGQKVKIPAK